MDFIKDLDVSYLHVFTYSERARTTAPKMSDSVPMKVRKDRSRQLQVLSEKKKRAFYEQNVGQTGTVLLEGEDNDGWMYGFSENYIKVKVPYREELINTFQFVHFNDIDRDGIMKCDIIVPAEA